MDKDVKTMVIWSMDYMVGNQKEKKTAHSNENNCNNLSPQGLRLVPLGRARDHNLIANAGYEASELQLPLGS